MNWIIKTERLHKQEAVSRQNGKLKCIEIRTEPLQ